MEPSSFMVTLRSRGRGCREKSDRGVFLSLTLFARPTNWFGRACKYNWCIVHYQNYLNCISGMISLYKNIWIGDEMEQEIGKHDFEEEILLTINRLNKKLLWIMKIFFTYIILGHLYYLYILSGTSILDIHYCSFILLPLILFCIIVPLFIISFWKKKKRYLEEKFKLSMK